MERKREERRGGAGEIDSDLIIVYLFSLAGSTTWLSSLTPPLESTTTPRVCSFLLLSLYYSILYIFVLLIRISINECFQVLISDQRISEESKVLHTLTTRYVLFLSSSLLLLFSSLFFRFPCFHLLHLSSSSSFFLFSFF